MRPMRIHIAIDGQQLGPMSLEEINARLADGRFVAGKTLAWHEGCPDWIPLSQVAGVVLPGEPVTPPVPSMPTRSQAGSPEATLNQESSGTLTSVIPYKNPMALTAYYLGIFSLIPILGAVLALPAIVLGVLGLRRHRRNPIAKGKAHAWVGISTGALSILVHFGLMFFRLLPL